MAVNPGKRFENDFQKSIDKNNIFIHRLKDGSTRTGANGEMVRLKIGTYAILYSSRAGNLSLLSLNHF